MSSSIPPTPTISFQFCYSGAVMRFFYFSSLIFALPWPHRLRRRTRPRKAENISAACGDMVTAHASIIRRKVAAHCLFAPLGGCETESAFLAQYMADNGYIVVARHQGCGLPADVGYAPKTVFRPCVVVSPSARRPFRTLRLTRQDRKRPAGCSFAVSSP